MGGDLAGIQEHSDCRIDSYRVTTILTGDKIFIVLLLLDFSSGWLVVRSDGLDSGDGGGRAQDRPSTDP